MSTLICGDAISEMNNLIAKGTKVNFVLADPPYGITNNKEDIVIPPTEMWKCIHGLSLPNTVTAIFCADLFYIDVVAANRKNYKYTWIWDKVLSSGHLNAKRMPMRNYEDIAVFYAKDAVYNPQMSVGKPNHSKGDLTKKCTNSNYGNHKMVESDLGGLKYPTRILRYQKPHPSKALHRTEKPVELLEYLIETYTNEGDTVLDFSMGSGSTGEACLRTNREFIGIEINGSQFLKAKDRIVNLL